MKLRSVLRKIPGAWRIVHPEPIGFRHSTEYWKERYEYEGNSGAGSYGRLALFKSRVLNDFVAENQIDTVLEFGCGDGNQLSLSQYPNYIGLDVSPVAVRRCISQFNDDVSKSFFLYDPTCARDNANIFCADVVLSLDVIYHLIEDEVYEAYMHSLFTASRRYVIVYSSNETKYNNHAKHVRHRCFTEWVEQEYPDWGLIHVIANEFPYDETKSTETSFADFFFFEKDVKVT